MNRWPDLPHQLALSLPVLVLVPFDRSQAEALAVMGLEHLFHFRRRPKPLKHPEHLFAQARVADIKHLHFDTERRAMKCDLFSNRVIGTLTH